MSYILDIMAAVNGQLNIISNDYSGGIRASNSLEKIPEFISASILRLNRSAMLLNNKLVDKETKKAIVEKAVVTYTNDEFNPIYIVSINNINKAFTDKVPLYVNHKNSHGAGIGYLIGVPTRVFDQSVEADEEALLLRDLYFRILDLDINMKYNASPAILRVSNSEKITIPTYDVELILCAIAYMQVTITQWYLPDDDNGPYDVKHVLNAFTDREIPKEMKSSISEILSKYCINANNLKTAIASGKVISTFVGDHT